MPVDSILWLHKYGLQLLELGPKRARLRAVPEGLGGGVGPPGWRCVERRVGDPRTALAGPPAADDGVQQGVRRQEAEHALGDGAAQRQQRLPQGGVVRRGVGVLERAAQRGAGRGHAEGRGRGASGPGRATPTDDRRSPTQIPGDDPAGVRSRMARTPSLRTPGSEGKAGKRRDRKPAPFSLRASNPPSGLAGAVRENLAG